MCRQYTSVIELIRLMSLLLMESTVKSNMTIITRDFEQKSLDQSRSFISTVGEIDWDEYKPTRAGILVYSIVNNRIHIGMGIDSRFKELTDFGGGIKYRKDGNALNAAMREFFEETLYVFNPAELDSLEDCTIIYNAYTCVILVQIHEDIHRISTLYRSRKAVLNRTEISKIEWIPIDRFTKMITSGRGIYARISDLLRKTPRSIDKIIPKEAGCL